MKKQDFENTNGHHVPRSRDGNKRRTKNKFTEGTDSIAARKTRASFKNYLREIEEREMIEDDYDAYDDN